MKNPLVTHMSRKAVAGLLLVASLTLSACGAIPGMEQPTQQSLVDRANKVGIFVSAHPDDEIQMWSLIDHTPGIWPIFVFMTQGESTSHCENTSSSPDSFVGPGLDPGEPTPRPIPQSKHSAECKQARLTSLKDFFAVMEASIPHVPSDFVTANIEPVNVPQNICNNHDGGCGNANELLQPLVWLDPLHRGAVVVFNTGDGETTAPEVEWAVQTVIDNRVEWGMSQAPIEMIAGNYYNIKPGCFKYDHVDHKAVHDGLRRLKTRDNDRTIYLAACNSETVKANIDASSHNLVIPTTNLRLLDTTINAAWGGPSPVESAADTTSDNDTANQSQDSDESNVDSSDTLRSESSGDDAAHADAANENSSDSTSDNSDAASDTSDNSDAASDTSDNPDAASDTVGNQPDNIATSIGAHPYAYGWLWPGFYPLDRDGQLELFHANQSFLSQ